MTSSFFNFSNVDILQYDSFEQNLSFEGQNFSQAYSKDSNFICTEAPCEDLFNPSSRSKKTSLNPFQSSFQCNFHYEHFETLNKKLQNFMESISSCSEKILKQELEKKILQNQMSSFSSCEEILESENCQIEESEKQKFKVDLKYEKKLREFLDEVCKKLIPEISGEFLAVADFIWVNYTKVMDQRLSESELINWAKNLSETKFKQYRKLLEKTKEICFSEDQSEVFPNFDEAIKGFMEFFFVTVILCVEQYFGNPYFQEDSIEVNSFKRASSESDCYSFDQFSELQQDIYGSKKLKF